MSDPKPAYVQFEIRPMEDREASLEAGHTVYKDVIFAVVTPAGTRDRLEKVADEWLANVKEGVQQDRIPPMWLDAYSHALKVFKETQENPTFGTALNVATTLTPAEIKNAQNANLRTIEELAEANEEAIQRMGMGGRAAKQKAEAWIKASQETGVSAAEIEKLTQINQDLSARLEKRDADVVEMKAQIEALQKLVKVDSKEK